MTLNCNVQRESPKFDTTVTTVNVTDYSRPNFDIVLRSLQIAHIDAVLCKASTAQEHCHTEMRTCRVRQLCGKQK